MSDGATTSWDEDQRTIWTIGHGDRDFDSVAAALTGHGVQTIVDVRSQPYSRHTPDFTKGELEIAAASAGFGYRWLGERLGGRPVASAEVMESGLGEVAGLAATSHVVLLCSETNPVHCHRAKTLAPALIDRNFHVIHILSDGNATPHQESLLEG